MAEQTTAKHIPMQQIEPTAVEALTRADIDMQIATAHRYPRSIAKCRGAAMAMALLSPEIAESCFYVIPRTDKDGKRIRIIGPSVRLGEIIASTWTNIRIATRFIAESATHVTTQAVCHDLESNVAISKEVRRKLSGKGGKRYSEDMVLMTANAAASIALRNAIFAVVPKAHWGPVYDAALKEAAGDQRTLPERIGRMTSWFFDRGILECVLLKLLGVPSVEAIGADELNTAQGMRTSLLEESTTVDQLIASAEEETGESTDEMIEADLRKKGKPDGEVVPNADAAPGSADEPQEPTAAMKLDTLRRKVRDIWVNLPPDKRANIARNVEGFDVSTSLETFQSTTDATLLQAVLDTMPGA